MVPSLCCTLELTWELMDAQALFPSDPELIGLGVGPGYQWDF